MRYALGCVERVGWLAGGLLPLYCTCKTAVACPHTFKVGGMCTGTTTVQVQRCSIGVDMALLGGHFIRATGLSLMLGCSTSDLRQGAGCTRPRLA
jgi:hypothetical protein